jgi:hypothetical protein
MIKPVRIQRKRTPGFNLDAESRKVNGLPAKAVTRGTRYGNPYKIGAVYRDAFTGGPFIVDEQNCLELYRLYVNGWLAADANWLEPLRGHNLACWCPLTDKDGKPVPCHADILLKILSERE